MTPYRAQHADLFRTVADILVRDYQAASETADTVEKWCEWASERLTMGMPFNKGVTVLLPSELAALIADVEGYEKR